MFSVSCYVHSIQLQRAFYITDEPIAATKSTVKVNFAPYLVDLILHGEIDPLRHKATVKDGVLNVKLFKITPGTWGRFDVTEAQMGAEADERRAEAMAAQGELESALRDKRRDRKSQDERFSTRKQMALEVRLYIATKSLFLADGMSVLGRIGGRAG